MDVAGEKEDGDDASVSLDTADREERAEEGEKATYACVWNMIDGRRRRKGETQAILVVIQ